jgi:DNA primase
VKIVLLPPGEDPDSYSKKVNNEEFTRYLKQNETDFIRFKTQLLLSEAQNDPVRRADLIRDIVKSIAVIPETITRTVYIKECSTLLDVPEQVLYNEVDKLRRQKSFQDRNKYPGPEDLPVPRVTAVRQVAAHDAGSFYSEREIIRLLLKYGSEELERKVSPEDGKEKVTIIADYIVYEIVSDELNFENATFAKIFNDYNFHVQQGLFPGDKHFVRHQDPDISSVSADLLADSHELSAIWKTKQTYIETEAMLLRDIVPDTVLKFKSDKLNVERKKLLRLIEEASKENDNEKIVTLQKKYSAISKALGRISKNLGDRIIL